MPVLTPSSGSMYERSGGAHSHIGGYDANGDKDVMESPEGQSNGPTPKSSSSGGDRGHYVTGQVPQVSQDMNGYRSSISPPQRNVGQYGGQPFFPGAGSGYPVPQSVEGQQFPVGNGWTQMGSGGQAQAEPMGEGVLRALMNMGPMDAMDLSSWDSGNEPMRG